MREWIAYLGEMIVVTAVAGIVYAIAPEGALKKHLHFVISLCVLVSLAVPLFSVISELPEIFTEEKEVSEEIAENAESELVKDVISASKKEIETALVSFISEQFDIKSDDISVSLTLDAENTEAIEITKIKVEIVKLTSSEKKKIETTLDEMFLGKSEIVVISKSE